jgi:hypothetical protein
LSHTPGTLLCSLAVSLSCCGSLFISLTPSPSFIRQRGVRKLGKTPNGLWSFFPAILAFIGWGFSITSGMACNFVSRHPELIDPSDGDLLEIGAIIFSSHGIGFWGWGHRGTCYSYEISGAPPSFDSAFRVSNGLTTLTVLLGGICMVCSWLGTCFPIFPRIYWYLGVTFILNGVFGFSTLAVLGSTACGPGFFSYTTGTIDLETIST